jgi:hypothetical protein
LPLCHCEEHGDEAIPILAFKKCSPFPIRYCYSPQGRAQREGAQPPLE